MLAATPGAYRTVVGTNPAANVEISETVPAGETWLLLAVSALLVQGATQTPLPILVIDDGTNVIHEAHGATAAQAASTTARYTWAAGLPAPAALLGATPDLHGLAPLPYGLILPAGCRVRTNTIGKGANTDWGAPVLLVAKL